MFVIVNGGTAGSMVYSTGIDIVDISRVGYGYRRFGDKYIRKLFSESERNLIEARGDGILTTMAGKLAAKEAVIKCLGVFFDHGVAFHDIEILDRPSKMPYVRLPHRLMKKLDGRSVLLSVTHEKRYAAAVALITDEA
jgi:holo-[acyl-carrier protein] synthase